MSATPNESYSQNPAIRDIANSLILGGRIGFWLQLALAGISGISLLYAGFGRNFSETNQYGFSVFFAFCGIATLLFGVFIAFRYTRIGKSFLNNNSRPTLSKADLIALLRMAIITSFIGILFSLCGAGFGLAVQIAKAVSQPPGVAITDPSRIIRAIDVFIVAANVNAIAAHFIGGIISLWLIERTHR
jgi:hypothetical protein